MAKVVGNLFGIGFLAYAHLARLGINLCRIGKNWIATAAVHNFLVLAVVVTEDAKENQADDQACRYHGTQNGAPQHCLGALSAGNFKFYGQTNTPADSPLSFLRRMAGQSVTCWC